MLGGVFCSIRRIMPLGSRYVACFKVPQHLRLEEGSHDYVTQMLISVQKGMWAMIGTSIALVLWTSGLLYLTTKAEKKRITEAEAEIGDEKQYEAGVTGDVKV
jgi:hypothetical protein